MTNRMKFTWKRICAAGAAVMLFLMMALACQRMTLVRAAETAETTVVTEAQTEAADSQTETAAQDDGFIYIFLIVMILFVVIVAVIVVVVSVSGASGAIAEEE